MAPLRAPFPWFGGKSLASPLIWRAFGNVPNYIEPFAGSLAVLLARPGGPGKVETVNDKDGLIANFWRATRDRPAEVARWADWPVNEADLHARHRWLVAAAPTLLERLIDDPEYSDPKIAGWWVWGICTWPGGQWCRSDAQHRRMPDTCNAHGRGVHAVARWLPAVGKPGQGVHARSREAGIAALFAALAERLRRVRICCGDWRRVLGDSTLGIDTNHAMTPCAVLLDPPYALGVRRRSRMYREDDEPAISADVRAWAVERGHDSRLRIALCGIADEHDMPTDWTSVAWRAHSKAKSSRARERIWFSPHCLPAVHDGDLFADRTPPPVLEAST